MIFYVVHQNAGGGWDVWRNGRPVPDLLDFDYEDEAWDEARALARAESKAAGKTVDTSQDQQ